MAAAKKTTSKAAKKEEFVTVTQEMIDAHPEWEDVVKVGDTIEASSLEEETTPSEETEEAPKAKVSKEDGSFAIVKNSGEFIRIYNVKALAQEFAGKDVSRQIVDPKTIDSLVVSFDVIDPKSKVVSRKSENFSVEDWELAMDRTYAMKGVCMVKTA